MTTLLPNSVALTPAQRDYQAAIFGMDTVLAELYADAPGPALTTPEAKAALLQGNAAGLRAFEDSLRAFTAAGHRLSPAELEPFHQPAQKVLHRHLLQSPFARRAFGKPLGYAGDYVMVRHILEEPLQGESAFAQLMNFALVQADVAEGHRNRIDVLEKLLTQQAARAHEEGRRISVLSIGCGPAEETHRFIKNCPHADLLDITLLDFDAETLAWTAARLATTCAQVGRNPNLSFVQESVYNLAKQRLETVQSQYDVVICAGLFDYLTDRFCQRVLNYGVKSLLPGGTVLVTNVSVCNSSFSMSKLLEWDLVYRSADELAALLPEGPEVQANVYVDGTETNVMAELTRLV